MISSTVVISSHILAHFSQKIYQNKKAEKSEGSLNIAQNTFQTKVQFSQKGVTYTYMQFLPNYLWPISFKLELDWRSVHINAPAQKEINTANKFWSATAI